MSNDRIVVQLTITVGGDGTAVCDIHPPLSGPPGATPGLGENPNAPRPPKPVGSTGVTAPTGTCAAQRTVHMVAGNGGLAWFTLIWPVPEVATNNNAQFALDDRIRFGLVPGTESEHPLHVRKIGNRLLWDGTGTHPHPTVFVAGVNQTHTATPITTTITGGPEVVAAGAVAQAGLAPQLPVLSFRQGLSFSPAPGAPGVVVVPNIDAAITAIRGVTSISPAVELDLQPSATKLATWVDASTPQALADLARNLLFTANAFRLGLIGTVLMPAFNDDPHGAFSGGDALATARADGLARVLDGFYAELAAHPEPKCTTVGASLSLADNVVTIVSGDTPKNFFNRNGWGDGTPGGANLIYVRGNGYLKPGWFGDINVASGRVNFDPVTGAQSTASSSTASTTAAQLAILFAISRGDVSAVARASSAPYRGVVATTVP